MVEGRSKTREIAHHVRKFGILRACGCSFSSSTVQQSPDLHRSRPWGGLSGSAAIHYYGRLPGDIELWRGQYQIPLEGREWQSQRVSGYCDGYRDWKEASYRLCDQVSRLEDCSDGLVSGKSLLQSINLSVWGQEPKFLQFSITT
jgi:hypothetical protein